MAKADRRRIADTYVRAVGPFLEEHGFKELETWEDDEKRYRAQREGCWHEVDMFVFGNRYGGQALNIRLGVHFEDVERAVRPFVRGIESYRNVVWTRLSQASARPQDWGGSTSPSSPSFHASTPDQERGVVRDVRDHLARYGLPFLERFSDKTYLAEHLRRYPGWVGAPCINDGRVHRAHILITLLAAEGEWDEVAQVAVAEKVERGPLVEGWQVPTATEFFAEEIRRGLEEANHDRSHNVVRLDQIATEILKLPQVKEKKAIRWSWIDSAADEDGDASQPSTVVLVALLNGGVAVAPLVRRRDGNKLYRGVRRGEPVISIKSRAPGIGRFLGDGIASWDDAEAWAHGLPRTQSDLKMREAWRKRVADGL